MHVLVVILIPLAGTILGAAMVLFMKKNLSYCIEKLLLGFAVGVMLAASVWSLLIPSLEIGVKTGDIAWAPTVIGFVLGIMFLLLLDTLTPHLHLYSGQTEGVNKNISSQTMLFFAVTLHNFPEGMAVGAILAGLQAGISEVNIAGVMVLAIGIAIQNFPEGAIISMPLRSMGMSRRKAFCYGSLSGLAEPVGAAITILIAAQMVPLLPYFLAFAAGAMVYVVVDELIPESRSDDCYNLGTIGTALGFSLMMILDVSLG